MANKNFKDYAIAGNNVTLTYDDVNDTVTFDAAGNVLSVNGKTGDVVLNKTDISLGNVDNTSDVNKPISTATQLALNSKQDSLGFTAENIANKSTSVTTDQASNIKYPSVKAVYDWAIGLFVSKNVAITPSTKTKITYDANGLVTAGADLSATDIPSGIDASKIGTGIVSNAEYGYLDGVTSAIQTQLDSKQPSLGFTPVPNTRTLTINGTAYDLSANRTWVITTPTLDAVTTAGNTTTNSISVGKITTTASITASAALAQGSYFNNTLVAAANNDVLVGVDINPTFTNGAFTGVTNYALRTSDNIFVTNNRNNDTEIRISNTTSNTSAKTQFGAISNNGAIFLQKTSTLFTTYKIINGNDGGLYNTTGDLYFLNEGTGNIKMAAGGSSTAHFRIFSNGNIGINQNTDAGYKLDVNGTARVQGNLVVSNNGTVSIGSVILNLNSQSGGSISSANSAGNNNGPFITLYGPTYMNPTAGNSGLFSITGEYRASSGTAIFNHLNLAPIINNTSTYVGTVRGFYYNPTLTSLVGTTHRAIETTSGDVIFGSTSGNVGIGTTTIPAKLNVSGSITASSSLAQGVYFNNTLVAAANNDVLVGLDINPTFTNGAFTGVNNIALRLRNGVMRFASLSADPSNPANGDMYYNTTANTFKVYQGGAWKTITTA